MVQAMRHVGTVEQASLLAAELNDASRVRPVVVVSSPASRGAPYIDAAKIFNEVGDLVEVVTIPTGAVSWAFSAAMVAGTQVYGGAGRVYPVGVEWVGDVKKSPLRFAFDAREGAAATQALIDDALHMAAAAGLLGQTAAGASVIRPVEGTVTKLIAGRALVRTTGGSVVSIVGELAVPDLPIERLLVNGMTVRGAADDANRLDIRAMLRPAAALPYRAGEIVLARVDAVSENVATLSLHPDLPVEVTLIDVTLNDLDTLDTLMSPSEVLRARIESREPWKLRLWDVDDDEVTVAAFSLIEGGPPWLVEGLPKVDTDVDAEAEHRDDREPTAERGESTASATAPTAAQPSAPAPAPAKTVPNPSIFDRKRRPAAPTPAATSPTAVAPVVHTPNVVAPAPKPAPPSPSPATPQPPVELIEARERLQELDAKLRDLIQENRELLTHRNRLRDQVERLERQLATSRKNLRGSRTQTGMELADEGPWFLDPVDQFTFEVAAAWARRIPAAEKSERPLRAYTLGQDFLRSVDQLEGIKRPKIVEVVVEILTGLAEKNAGRELHRLRESGAGNARQRVRDDGATGWRVSLQVNTPSARRLHFWRTPDGHIELAKVAVHDDYSA